MIDTFSTVFIHWTIIYSFHFLLKSLPFTKNGYLNFLDRIGIKIRFFQASIFTKQYNSVLHKFISYKTLPWKNWFTIGVAFSIIFMFLSYIVLFYCAFWSYHSLMGNLSTGPILSSLIPGLKFSISNILIYSTTLIFCAVVHETGHALAALLEKVRLNGFGLFFIGLYPGAFVDLNTSDLTMLNPIRQLRIYCAGVWHNIVILIISLIIYYGAPNFFSPLYFTQSGVSVTFIETNSVLTGNRGLQIGDSIYQINSCSIQNSSDWINCLQDAHLKPSGYCLAGSYLQQQLTTKGSYITQVNRSLKSLAIKSKLSSTKDQEMSDLSDENLNESDCCPIELSATHLCFRFDRNKFYNLKNKRSKFRNYIITEEYYRLCLPARSVTERKACNSITDCGPNTVLSLPSKNQTIRSSVCVIPSPKGNNTRLFRLVHNRPWKPAILFLGPVTDLYSFVGVSDYIPRWPFIISARFPNIILMFCYYSFSLSGALLLFNSIPCYSLDGQWILKAILEYLLPNRVRLRFYLFTLLTCLGTFLLSINVIFEFIHIYLDKNNLYRETVTL